MNSSVVFPYPGIILNTCCLIDLYASGYISDILQSLPVPVAITTYTYEREKLPTYLRSANDEGLSANPSGLLSLVQSGVLIVASPTNEERVSMNDFAASVKVDGEAYTLALAFHRHWAIGVDDLHAQRWFRRYIQESLLLSTPTFIKYWAERSSLATDELTKILQKVWSQTGYQPLLDDPLCTWWKKHIGL